MRESKRVREGVRDEERGRKIVRNSGREGERRSERGELREGEKR